MKPNKPLKTLIQSTIIGIASQENLTRNQTLKALCRFRRKILEQALLQLEDERFRENPALLLHHLIHQAERRSRIAQTHSGKLIHTIKKETFEELRQKWSANQLLLVEVNRGLRTGGPSSDYQGFRGTPGPGARTVKTTRL